MKRKVDWRPALGAYLETVSRRPFTWGEHDCALFAAGAVEAMTGEDFAAGYRDRYKTLRGGLRLLRADGFADHAAFAASRFERHPPAEGMVGDVAAIEIEGGIALGIVQGERIYVLKPGEDGIGTVPLRDAREVFRVPFTD